MSSDLTYVVFGSGKYAEKVISEMALQGFSVEYVVDNNKEKWGTVFHGFLIKDPSILKKWKEQCITVVIAVSNAVFYREIANQLSELGMIEERDFFNGIKIFHLLDLPHGWVSGYLNLPEGFDSIKTFDNQSRLIVRKDEKKIFRIVKQEYAERYRQVYDRCLEKGLLGADIVDTKIIENSWNVPFGLILEHSFIEPISYCFEWSPKTFMNYVIYMIHFIKKLDESSLALKDGHTLNATFYKGRFVFLDFGALDDGKTPYLTMQEFINTHIIPLLLMSKNQTSKAYLFLKNPGLTYTLIDIIGYLTPQEVDEFKSLSEKCLKMVPAGKITEFCNCLLEYCNGLLFRPLESRWNGYQDEEWGSLEKEEIWTEKQKNIVDLIRTVRPKTLIDLAGNMGWYGAALSKQLDYAIVADLDYNCIDYLYSKVSDKSVGLSNIIPIYLNIITPTPDYYRDDVIGNTGVVPWRKNAIDRFRCDLVMAISVVHHLAFSQQLTFEEMIRQFKLFTNRYLVVEFIKKEDEYIKDFLKIGFDWYTEETFVQVLETEFTILSSKPSTPGNTRTLYLCEVNS